MSRGESDVEHTLEFTPVSTNTEVGWIELEVSNLFSKYAVALKHKLFGARGANKLRTELILQ